MNKFWRKENIAFTKTKTMYLKKIYYICWEIKIPFTEPVLNWIKPEVAVHKKCIFQKSIIENLFFFPQIIHPMFTVLFDGIFSHFCKKKVGKHNKLRLVDDNGKIRILKK